MEHELALALELADLADAATLPRFRSGDLAVATKADLTPVTEVDRGVEAVLRRRLHQARPGHGVVGEEGGSEGGGAWRWVLDPVDGTKNYLRGIPVWASLIALQHDGESVVGVVSAPALGRRWWAARGLGAFAGGERIRVSAVDRLGQAMLSYDNFVDFERRGLGEAVLDLARRVGRSRGLGDFWSHVLVAEGAVDIAVEPEVALWDLAALQIIVEEAGGRFSDLAGVARADGGSAVSTNGVLHDEVLAALRLPAGG